MNKGLIGIDLDGTLLDARGTYSRATGDYLRALASQGYDIVIATGRPYRAMKRIYEDLRLNSPVICYNGALVFHPKDESFAPIKRAFPSSTIKQIVKGSAPIVLSYMAESSRSVYIDIEDPFLERYFPYSNMKIVEGPLGETVNEDVFTCLFHSVDGTMDELKKHCESFPGIAWRSWSNCNYSELYIPGADKGSAFAYVRQTLGYGDDDRVYAFGDAENDIAMLEKAGHPFAMKHNKVPDLLSRFPQTKNSVDEDGVMNTLKEILI